MDNRIVSQVLLEYEQLRRENARIEEQRRQEMAARHPDLMALMEKRHEMVLRSVRNLFAQGNGQDPESLMEAYNQKIAGMLKEYGYPADYLSPIFRCEACGDTGFYYDEEKRQQMCSCLKNACRAAVSGMGGELEMEKTFENFDPARFPDTPLENTDVTQRELMAIIRKKCQAFAENVPGGPIKTLLLHGGSGLGKTYLLHCIGHHCRKRNVDTLYTTAYDLLMQLKNAYFSRENGDAADYFQAPLLIIDDLGMEPLMENITVEQMYHLINTRLSRGLYTAISTNLSRLEIQKRYTERVSSRLLDARTGMTISFLGKDIRLMKQG